MRDPIDRIEWLPVTALNANDYNPNVVMTPELRLLELSILKTGWVQPVLVSPTGRIIDGFHRWMLSKTSKPIHDRYGDLPRANVEKVNPYILDSARLSSVLIRGQIPETQRTLPIVSPVLETTDPRFGTSLGARCTGETSSWQAMREGPVNSCASWTRS